MCGFVVEKNKNRPVDETNIQGALTAISHRGPDYSSVWISPDGRTGLGHARLSIIDLESGNQPIVNRTHGISIVVNGELYDYRVIRQELQAKGYVFQTRSDSEIILFLYLEYGVELFSHLRGEFAFVLFDERNDLLLAGRDRFGIKPLCYYREGERLLIASEAKALFALGVDRAWDAYSWMHAASLQYQPTDKTFFKNIDQLSPGHFMVYKNNTLQIEKYWDLNYPVETEVESRKSDQDYIEEFREHLSDSIRLRLMSDVPVCFHLSGGLDSSAVVGLADQHLTEKKHCFTVAFDGQEQYDELGLAQETAALTNSELHIVNVTQDDILNHLSDAVYYSEGLAVNGHITGKYLLNRGIQKAGFKVALTGEGSDEVLAGYPHLRQDLLEKAFHSTPDIDTKRSLIDKDQLVAALYESNRVSVGVQLAQGDGLDVSELEKQLGFVPSFLRAKASFGLKVQSVLSDDLIQNSEPIDFYQDMLGAYDWERQLKGRHPVNQSLYLWTKLTLVNYILNTLGDGCEMSSSIEGRLPFLDHKLFEFTRGLPLDLKIRNGNEKYILKEAVKPFITDSVYKRQKHPFMAPPLSHGVQEKNFDFIRDHLNSAAFRNVPFFDSAKVQALLDRLPRMGREELTAHEPVLMFMLTSCFLHERLGLS